MAGPHIFVRVQIRATALSTGELRTKTVYNVYDYKRTTTSGNPSKANFLTAFKTAVITPLSNCLSVSYIAGFSDVRWLDDPLDPYTTNSSIGTGTVAGDSLPSVNNVCMRLGTGVRGRSNRGSKHFGPIAESHTLLDYLTAAAITLWGTFQAAYLANITASDGFVYSPCVVSQKNSVFNATTATVVANVVTTTTVNNYLGIMRKRAQERANTM